MGGGRFSSRSNRSRNRKTHAPCLFSLSLSLFFLSIGPLRRVQPRLRPRHDLRPQDRRPRRVHPDVAAALGEVGVLPQGRGGVAGGKATLRDEDAEGVGVKMGMGQERGERERVFFRFLFLFKMIFYSKCFFQRRSALFLCVCVCVCVCKESNPVNHGTKIQKRERQRGGAGEGERRKEKEKDKQCSSKRNKV